ncbi:uncharacterized protein [Oscarella lobularis]|uniref:uncharacterized protein n=1 Tax=Oscarella lobularis TaxID=121494 RepID=UPI003314450A
MGARSSSSLLESLERAAYRGRSFPIEALAESYTTTKGINEAHREGESKALHKRVFILGDKGVGKTSTLKSLTCQNFNRQEKGTEGAESYDARAYYDKSNCMWKAEDKNLSNFSRFLIQSGIQNISQHSLLEEAFYILFLLLLLLFTFAINYAGKNALITTVVPISLVTILLHKNPDAIGRVILTTFGACLLFDFLLVMFLQAELNLLLLLSFAWITGSLFGLLFFSNIASGFLQCCMCYGVAPGYLLNAKCITITPTLYAQSAFFFALGMALGYFLEKLTSKISDRLRPWFSELAAYSFVYVFVIAILQLLVKGLLIILGVAVSKEGETMSQYLHRNSENELLITLVLWTSVGMLFTAGLKGILEWVRSALESLLQKDMSELTKKWWYHAYSFAVGVVLARLVIALFRSDGFCDQLFKLSLEQPYLYNVISVISVFLLELSYWFPLLNLKPSKCLQGIIAPAFFSEMTKAMKKGRCSINDLLQPLLKIIDFAGEEVYYAMHHMFLRDKSVYLIVFKFEDFKKAEQDAVVRWVKSAYSYGRKSRVFLVGTHRDSCSEDEKEDAVFNLYKELRMCSKDLLNVVHCDKREFPEQSRSSQLTLPLVYQIENSSNNFEDETLVRLREHIVDEYYRLRNEDPRKFSSAVFRLEEEITKEITKEKDQRRLSSIVAKSELQRSIAWTIAAKEANSKEADANFELALEYLNESGVIHTLPKGIVVLRPQFLINAAEALISAHYELQSSRCLSDDMRNFYHQGILNRAQILKIWKERDVTVAIDEDTDSALLGILEQNGIIVRISESTASEDENYGVITCLPTKPLSQQSLKKENSFYVVLSDAFGMHCNIFFVLMAKARRKFGQPLKQVWSKFYGTFRLNLQSDSNSYVDYVMQCYKKREVYRISFLNSRGKVEYPFSALIGEIYSMLCEVQKDLFPQISFDIGPLCPIHQSRSAESRLDYSDSDGLNSDFDAEDVDCFAPDEHALSVFNSKEGANQGQKPYEFHCDVAKIYLEKDQSSALEKWLQMGQTPRECAHYSDTEYEDSC